MSLFSKFSLQNFVNSQTSSGDFVSEIVSAVKANDSKKAVKMLAVKSTSKQCAIPYTKEAVLKDMEIIGQFKAMYSPSDYELTAAIISTMLHKTHKSTLDILKEHGCDDITFDKLSYIGTYICTLKSLDEFKSCNIKKFKVSTCGDERVCQTCAKHDGKVHMAEKACIGKNAPPFCSKCRYIIRPVFKQQKKPVIPASLLLFPI